MELYCTSQFSTLLTIAQNILCALKEQGKDLVVPAVIAARGWIWPDWCMVVLFFTKKQKNIRDMMNTHYKLQFNFIIALSLWIYNHAFIVQNVLLYFEGRVTHMSKINTTLVLDI